jgi:hypothetical protein
MCFSRYFATVVTVKPEYKETPSIPLRYLEKTLKKFKKVYNTKPVKFHRDIKLKIIHITDQGVGKNSAIACFISRKGRISDVSACVVVCVGNVAKPPL